MNELADFYRRPADEVRGAPQDILDELQATGFTIKASRVAPRQSQDDQDDLLVIASKP